jgi:hypothetical protein
MQVLASASGYVLSPSSGTFFVAWAICSPPFGWRKTQCVQVARAEAFTLSLVIDENEANYRKSGILAWQLHAAPPLRIEMKNIRLRRIK